MPAVSESQRRFFGAELGRKRKGESTETGMSEESLRDFAAKRKGTSAARKSKRGKRKHKRKSRK